MLRPCDGIQIFGDARYLERRAPGATDNSKTGIQDGDGDPLDSARRPRGDTQISIRPRIKVSATSVAAADDALDHKLGKSPTMQGVCGNGIARAKT